jgi:hypothetical protein
VCAPLSLFFFSKFTPTDYSEFDEAAVRILSPLLLFLSSGRCSLWCFFLLFLTSCAARTLVETTKQDGAELNRPSRKKERAEGTIEYKQEREKKNSSRSVS